MERAATLQQLEDAMPAPRGSFEDERPSSSQRSSAPSDASEPQQHLQGKPRKYARRTSLPVPPPSPFLPYASADFSVPLETMLSSQLSNHSTTFTDSTSQGSMHNSGMASKWRAAALFAPATQDPPVKSSKGSNLLQLFACFGTGLAVRS